MDFCKIGIDNAVNKAIKNNPDYSYDEKSGIIEIGDNPSKDLNQYTSIRFAKGIAAQINKFINDGEKAIGRIAYSSFYKERGIVRIAPTNSQLELINSNCELVGAILTIPLSL